MRAPGQYAWRLALRLGAAIGAWAASAQSARATRRRSRCRSGRHALREPRGPREGQAGVLQQLTAPFKLRQARARMRLADLRALRDDQRVKDAEVAAQQVAQCAGPSASIAGAGPVDVALCCMLHGCRLWLFYCFSWGNG
jgi:hypothetical protein